MKILSIFANYLVVWPTRVLGLQLAKRIFFIRRNGYIRISLEIIQLAFSVIIIIIPVYMARANPVQQAFFNFLTFELKPAPHYVLYSSFKSLNGDNMYRR